MDFKLSHEQVMVKDLCRNFAKNEIMPVAEELDKTGQFPYAVWKKWVIWGFAAFPFLRNAGVGDWIGCP